MGELLQQFDAKGKRSDLEPTDSSVLKLSQKDVAQSIGLSERQSPDQSHTISAPTPKYF